MGAIQRRAAAKVNLGLEVVGKRADGYHELVTIFQAVDLFDEVGRKARSAGNSRWRPTQRSAAREIWCCARRERWQPAQA